MYTLRNKTNTDTMILSKKKKKKKKEKKESFHIVHWIVNRLSIDKYIILVSPTFSYSIFILLLFSLFIIIDFHDYFIT